MLLTWRAPPFSALKALLCVSSQAFGEGDGVDVLSCRADAVVGWLRPVWHRASVHGTRGVRAVQAGQLECFIRAMSCRVGGGKEDEVNLEQADFGAIRASLLEIDLATRGRPSRRSFSFSSLHVVSSEACQPTLYWMAIAVTSALCRRVQCADWFESRPPTSSCGRFGCRRQTGPQMPACPCVLRPCQPLSTAVSWRHRGKASIALLRPSLPSTGFRAE